MAETGGSGVPERTSHQAWGRESGEGPGDTIVAVLRRGSAVKAVVIDQWPMLRLGLARVLQTVDVRVVGEAASRVDGIRAARDGNAELVLLGDHTGGEPHEVVAEVKALPASPFVIVLVGQGAPDAVAAVLTAGADGLLVRSVGPDELASSVTRV